MQATSQRAACAVSAEPVSSGGSYTRLLALLCVVAAVDAACSVAAGQSLLPYLSARLGGPHTPTALRAAAPLAALLAAPALGSWAGTVRSRGGADAVTACSRLVLVSLVLSAVSLLCCATAPALPLLFAARALAGIGGGGVLWAAAAAAVSCEGASVPAALALLAAAAGLGTLAGGLGGYAMRNAVGLDWTASIVATVLAACAAVVARGMPSLQAPGSGVVNARLYDSPAEAAAPFLGPQLALRAAWSLAMGALLSLSGALHVARFGASGAVEALVAQSTACGLVAAACQVALAGTSWRGLWVASPLNTLALQAAAAVAAAACAVLWCSPTVSLSAALPALLGLTAASALFSTFSLTFLLLAAPRNRIATTCGAVFALDVVLRETAGPWAARALLRAVGDAPSVASVWGPPAFAVIAAAAIALLVALSASQASVRPVTSGRPGWGLPSFGLRPPPGALAAALYGMAAAVLLRALVSAALRAWPAHTLRLPSAPPQLLPLVACAVLFSAAAIAMRRYGMPAIRLPQWTPPARPPDRLRLHSAVTQSPAPWLRLLLLPPRSTSRTQPCSWRQPVQRRRHYHRLYLRLKQTTWRRLPRLPWTSPLQFQKQSRRLMRSRSLNQRRR